MGPADKPCVLAAEPDVADHCGVRRYAVLADAGEQQWDVDGSGDVAADSVRNAYLYMWRAHRG